MPTKKPLCYPSLPVTGERNTLSDSPLLFREYLGFHVLQDKCAVLKISEPIKSHWATEKNLNLNELLSDSQYKEAYRIDMIKWSDEMRCKDYGYFCRISCRNAADKPIWIVSDIRRKTDIRWFRENYGDKVKTIRIGADEETRLKRGFLFQTGVDNVMSECDLDDYKEWDLIIDNSEGGSQLQEQLTSIMNLIQSDAV